MWRRSNPDVLLNLSDADLQDVDLRGANLKRADLTGADLRGADLVGAQLGEAETALWRLLTEQRKTQKRVNALKYNVIPRYHATIRYIESVLSEEERDTLFQLKVMREQAEASANN